MLQVPRQLEGIEVHGIGDEVGEGAVAHRAQVTLEGNQGAISHRIPAHYIVFSLAQAPLLRIPERYITE